MPNVSLFRGTTNAQPVGVLRLAEVLDAIQSGAYQRPVQRLRELMRTQGQAAYNIAKRMLPAVTFCGTFSPTRAKANLVQHSGIVHGDIDHLADVAAAKQRLAADPYVIYVFISPSATGLKPGVRVAPVADDSSYKRAWQAVADYLAAEHGVTLDPSGKDVCRLCYVSYDPQLYRNEDARPFPVPDPAPRPAPRPTLPQPAYDVPRGRRERYAQQALRTAVAMIEASTPGSRHYHRLKASELLGGYIAGGLLTYDEAWGALAPAVARHTEHLDRSMKTVADGLLHGQERPITLDALAAERQTWLAQHHTSQDRERPLPSGTPKGGTPFRTSLARHSPQLRTIPGKAVPAWR
jgi:hypothetical protein